MNELNSSFSELVEKFIESISVPEYNLTKANEVVQYLRKNLSEKEFPEILLWDHFLMGVLFEVIQTVIFY